jgi:N-acetylglutamate synthase-like GNAT family acetyltransferase
MPEETLTKIIIREATVEDIDRINVFITPFIDEKKLLPRTHDELKDLIKNLFIAEVNGDIMGCAALEIYSKKLAEIRSLAVAHEVQGLGIGRKLVTACVERAKSHNILEVMAVTSSEDFFKACGFDFTLPGEKKALFFQTKDT